MAEDVTVLTALFDQMDGWIRELRDAPTPTNRDNLVAAVMATAVDIQKEHTRQARLSGLVPIAGEMADLLEEEAARKEPGRRRMRVLDVLGRYERWVAARVDEGARS